MSFFKKINFFMILVVIAALSFTMRLNSVIQGKTSYKKAVIINTAQAVEEAKPEDIDPPPMPKESETTIRKDDGKDPSLTSENDKAEQAELDRIQKSRHLPSYNNRAFTDSELEVLQSLSKRRAMLEKREQQIAQQQALLDAAENEVDLKITEMNQIRAELKELLDVQEEAQEQRLRRLVKIYESMKPKDAANIFNTLEMKVLLQVLGRMGERKSAPILASMDPAKARSVTIELVEQKKLPDIPE